VQTAHIAKGVAPCFVRWSQLNFNTLLHRLRCITRLRNHAMFQPTAYQHSPVYNSTHPPALPHQHPNPNIHSFNDTTVFLTILQAKDSPVLCLVLYSWIYLCMFWMASQSSYGEDHKR